MTHQDFQVFSLFAGSASLCSFILLSAMPRTRSGGLVGLLGSALLLFAIVRGEFFHNIANVIAFETIAGVLLLVSSASLLASSVLTLKKRTA